MNAARRRGEALHKLEELRVIILEHILKLSICPESESKDHWKKEIKAFQKHLQRYHKSKSGKGNYTKDLLWEYLWEDQVDMLPLGFIEDYGLKKVNLDVEDVKEKVMTFIEEILMDA